MTLWVTGLPTTFDERDVRAALLDRGAGRIDSIYVVPAPAGELRTAKVRLAWRAAHKVMTSGGSLPLAYRLEDP